MGWKWRDLVVQVEVSGQAGELPLVIRNLALVWLECQREVPASGALQS